MAWVLDPLRSVRDEFLRCRGDRHAAPQFTQNGCEPQDALHTCEVFIPPHSVQMVLGPRGEAFKALSQVDGIRYIHSSFNGFIVAGGSELVVARVADALRDLCCCKPGPDDAAQEEPKALDVHAANRHTTPSIEGPFASLGLGQLSVDDDLQHSVLAPCYVQDRSGLTSQGKKGLDVDVVPAKQEPFSYRAIAPGCAQERQCQAQTSEDWLHIVPCKSASPRGSVLAPCYVQEHHRQVPTVETSKQARAKPSSSGPEEKKRQQLGLAPHLESEMGASHPPKPVRDAHRCLLEVLSPTPVPPSKEPASRDSSADCLPWQNARQRLSEVISPGPAPRFPGSPWQNARQRLSEVISPSPGPTAKYPTSQWQNACQRLSEVISLESSPKCPSSRNSSTDCFPLQNARQRLSEVISPGPAPKYPASHASFPDCFPMQKPTMDSARSETESLMPARLSEVSRWAELDSVLVTSLAES